MKLNSYASAAKMSRLSDNRVLAKVQEVAAQQRKAKLEAKQVLGHCSSTNFTSCPEPFYECRVCVDCGYCAHCCKKSGCQN